jgi:PAS domain S-box-containing protein
VVHAPDTRILLFNQTALTLLGLSAEQMLGKAATDPTWHFVSETGDPMPLEEYPVQQVLATRRSLVNFVVGVNHPISDVRTWVLVNAFPEFDGQQQLRQIVVTFLDITERKRAEEYEAMGREVLRIFNEPESLPDSLLQVIAALKTGTGLDAVGIRLQVGEDFPYVAQAGFPQDFLLTENSLLACAADGGVCRDQDGNACLACLCGLVISGKTPPAHPLFTPGGSFWISDSFPLLDLPFHEDPRYHPRNLCIHQGYASVALVPIRQKDEIVGLLQFNDRRKRCFTLAIVQILEGMASHLGEALMRKQAEAEQARLAVQLRQAQKLESIGQLAGGVAHDFNNMLAATMMHLSSLQEHPNLAPEIQETVAELMEEAKRAANLTQQLLLFSRRSVMVMKVVDLNDLVAKMLKMLGRLIGEHIKVRFDRSAALPAVVADAGMFEQVLMNLAVNARDAMPMGGRLTISIEPVEVDKERVKGKPEVLPGPFVCLSVADTGCGMDEATRARIFEPFFTTKEVGKGTGLGLATVYGIVAQHKGWVEVESALGQGTTFKIFFPATAQGAIPPAQTEKRQPLRGHETILLVEDDASLRVPVARNLQKLGYRVLQAAHGPAALKVWQAHAGQIDLLFSDMVMPEGLTGLDLAEKLRAEKPSLKVIISSGYNQEMAGRCIPAAGGFVFLQKPYHLQDLSKTLRDYLDRA